MTDLPPTSSPPPAAKPDPWGIWFSRLIQVVGLAAFIYEVVIGRTERPWILLVATAMMMGGVGLQLVVRWALERFG